MNACNISCTTWAYATLGIDSRFVFKAQSHSKAREYVPTIVDFNSRAVSNTAWAYSAKLYLVLVDFIPKASWMVACDFTFSQKSDPKQPKVVAKRSETQHERAREPN